MRKPKKPNLGAEIIAALTELADRLDAGLPIGATEVRRFKTPDGPMHVRRPVVVQLPRRSGDQNA